MRKKICLTLLLVCTACSRNLGPSEPDTLSITARTARVEIKVPEGQMVLRGDALVCDEGGEEIGFRGDASVTLRGEAALDFRARSITLHRSGHKIILKGDVNAQFEAPLLKELDENL